MPPPQNHLKGSLTEFKGLLAMVVFGEDQDRDKFFIWVTREYGVVKSWVKQVVPFKIFSFFCCTNNGKLLITSDYVNLCLFDPETLHVNLLGVRSIIWATHTATFVENLVLLDQV